jgi:hypothetical protein
MSGVGSSAYLLRAGKRLSSYTRAYRLEKFKSTGAITAQVITVVAIKINLNVRRIAAFYHHHPAAGNGRPSRLNRGDRERWANAGLIAKGEAMFQAIPKRFVMG